MTHLGEAFDFIVVGAGSAGCIVAEGLSADSRVSVLVLEAGPPPRSPWIAMPAGLPRLLQGPYAWPDMTVAAAGLDGRRVWLGHGRTLGGSSAINGMVYTRGHPQDYEAWVAQGANGWGWADLVPHFERIEQALGITLADGRHRVFDAFARAGATIGLCADEDRALLRMTISRGRRRSSYDTFLRPVRSRRNLAVVTGATVRSLRIEQGRVVGVDYVRRGARHFASARREVVLCAGAIDSPRLLMLSGIGPGAHLAAQGIAVRHDLPGVGANLQDHVATGSTTVATVAAASMNPQITGWRQLVQGLRYLLTRTGPVTLGSSSAGFFTRLDAASPRPQVQISFRPFSVRRGTRAAYEVERAPAVSASAAWLHPFARGTVRLAGPDPEARPLIDPAYLADPRDEAGLLAGARIVAALFAAEPMRRLVTARRIDGGAHQSDDEVLARIRATAISMSHPAGTCRMGTDDDAVVDPRLSVRGLGALRVADASVMPEMPSGNTNAAAMVIGDRAAKLIRDG